MSTRNTLLVPVNQTDPKDYFAWEKYALGSLDSTLAPQHINETNTKAIPTNKWWANLFASDIFAVYPTPYMMTFSKEYRGIVFSYLQQYRTDGPVGPTTQAISYYFYPQIHDLTFSTKTFQDTKMKRPKFQIDDWDDLGVHLELSSDDDTRGNKESISFYLCLGQCFLSLRFANNCTPCITTVHSIKQVHKRSDLNFVIELNNGQFWVVYMFPEKKKENSLPETKGTFGFIQQHPNVIMGSGIFNGVIQVAILPPQRCGDQLCFDLYDKYAGQVIIGASLLCPDSASFGYMYKLERLTTANDFLHFAAPHHQSSFLEYSMKLVDISLLSNTHGKLQAFSCTPMCTNDSKLSAQKEFEAKWFFEFQKEIAKEMESNLTFMPLGSLSSSDLSTVPIVTFLISEIEEQMHNNKWQEWFGTGGSYYFKGKSLQKIGTICLLADYFNKKHTTKLISDELYSCAMNKFQSIMEDFASSILRNTNTSNAKYLHPLVYEQSYKGVVTSEVFSNENRNIDFGNGVYNDHHYHYGYFIASAAILYYLQPSLNIKQSTISTTIEFLIRDVLNPNNTRQILSFL